MTLEGLGQSGTLEGFSKVLPTGCQNLKNILWFQKLKKDMTPN